MRAPVFAGGHRVTVLALGKFGGKEVSLNFRCVNENQSLQNVIPIIIKKLLDGQVGDGFDFVRNLRDGNLLIKAHFNSQPKDLKLTQIHNLQVKVIPSSQVSKGVIFHRVFSNQWMKAKS